VGLLVHRVQGLVPGLYALCRDPDQSERLRRALSVDALWQRDPCYPAGLELFLLREGDYRQRAADVVGADSAGTDAAFGAVMIADYMDALVTYGAPFYRNLLWEAGMVGQVLCLEAARSSSSVAGSDRYLDDLVHETFGMVDREWQSMAHFEVRALTGTGAEP
jgi:hypothetical protein